MQYRPNTPQERGSALAVYLDGFNGATRVYEIRYLGLSFTLFALQVVALL